MKRLIGISLPIILIATMIFSVPVLADDPDSQEGHPIININHNISDKLRDPQFLESWTPTKPVPESDMVHIIFDKEWFFKHDIDPYPYNVTITFPQKWVSTGISNSSKGNAIELVVPARLLMENNESKNPEEVTVSLPNYYFNGLPEAPSLPEPVLPKSENRDVALQGIEFVERIVYGPTDGDNILGARGVIRPYSYSNPQGETFLTYHEIEFLSAVTSDALEVISWIDDSLATPRVWIAYYNGLNPFQSMCEVDVPLGTNVYYEFRTYPYLSYTSAYLRVNGTYFWGAAADPTPPLHWVNYDGSSELATEDGITKPFWTYTNPITITALCTFSWHSGSYVDQRLDLWVTSPDQRYVGITSIMTINGLYFFEFASN